MLKPINEALAIFRTDIQSALPPDWRDALDFNGDHKVTLLDFIFKWVPWFISCFPVPNLKGKPAT